MTKTFEEEVKEAYERASINLYGNIAGSIGMKKLLNELKDAGLLKEQQALSVVPECVAEIIKKYIGRQSVFGVLKTIALDRKTDVYEWVFSEGNQNIFALAFITGKYQVEKPQLFYLKHIDMSRKDKEFDHYLFRIEVDRLAHHIVNKNNLPHNYRSITFTQQEIDSMQTGSYEQIEVKE